MARGQLEMTKPRTMTGAVLPGNSTVAFREFEIPEPGHGEVLIRTKASTICGSDIRAIYREHLGKGSDSLTYTDGAQVACGFGTVYEGLERIGISGNDSVLVTGLGPVGLAALMLCKAMGATRLIGVDTVRERMDLAVELGLADKVIPVGPDTVQQVMALTGGKGVEKSADCSGNDQARQTCIRATRKWGKIVFIGEGGTCSFNPSPDIIHDQKTIYGSWVTNIWRMEELTEMKRRSAWL